MNEKLFVLKFGGSSLATPEQIKAVAEKIHRRHQAGEKLIVVTSAMGKTTDQLTDLARQISQKPNRRELDMLLTTGERISMALMSIALHDRGCPSISFTGSQAGIFTDGSFTNARITEIKPFRVAEALEKNRVVVIAGFQGVDPQTKEITTLGRGGSDTTAVALAAHFHAHRCEILKDVDGVFSADPKISSNAKLISEIPADKLYEFCFWGAKVLNHRSVELAIKHKVPLAIGRSDTFALGTFVSHKMVEKTSADSLNHLQMLGVNSHARVIQIHVKGVQGNDGSEQIKKLLENAGLPWPHILQTEKNQDHWNLWIACDALDEQDYISTFSRADGIHVLNKDLCTVTTSYQGDVSPAIEFRPRTEREETLKNIFG